jgi:hypothetical protein
MSVPASNSAAFVLLRNYPAIATVGQPSAEYQVTLLVSIRIKL